MQGFVRYDTAILSWAPFDEQGICAKILVTAALAMRWVNAFTVPGGTEDDWYEINFTVEELLAAVENLLVQLRKLPDGCLHLCERQSVLFGELKKICRRTLQTQSPGLLQRFDAAPKSIEDAMKQADFKWMAKYLEHGFNVQIYQRNTATEGTAAAHVFLHYSHTPADSSLKTKFEQLWICNGQADGLRYICDHTWKPSTDTQMPSDDQDLHQLPSKKEARTTGKAPSFLDAFALFLFVFGSFKMTSYVAVLALKWALSAVGYDVQRMTSIKFGRSMEETLEKLRTGGMLRGPDQFRGRVVEMQAKFPRSIHVKRLWVAASMINDALSKYGGQTAETCNDLVARLTWYYHGKPGVYQCCMRHMLELMSSLCSQHELGDLVTALEDFRGDSAQNGGNQKNQMNPTKAEQNQRVVCALHFVEHFRLCVQRIITNPESASAFYLDGVRVGIAPVVPKLKVFQWDGGRYDAVGKVTKGRRFGGYWAMTGTPLTWRANTSTAVPSGTAVHEWCTQPLELGVLDNLLRTGTAASKDAIKRFGTPRPVQPLAPVTIDSLGSLFKKLKGGLTYELSTATQEPREHPIEAQLAELRTARPKPGYEDIPHYVVVLAVPK
mmetsp:Transcript_29493/g.85990  ORF Transcript_29493/g.85990 Transcript_29493/m.85990 type:complete len:609 (-) Transcript_29493:32-1858(-)